MEGREKEKAEKKTEAAEDISGGLEQPVSQLANQRELYFRSGL